MENIQVGLSVSRLSEQIVVTVFLEPYSFVARTNFKHSGTISLDIEFSQSTQRWIYIDHIVISHRWRRLVINLDPDHGLV